MRAGGGGGKRVRLGAYRGVSARAVRPVCCSKCCCSWCLGSSDSATTGRGNKSTRVCVESVVSKLAMAGMSYQRDLVDKAGALKPPPKQLRANPSVVGHSDLARPQTLLVELQLAQHPNHVTLACTRGASKVALTLAYAC